MPTQSAYDIGLDWWNSQNSSGNAYSDGTGYWDSFFQDSNLLSSFDDISTGMFLTGNPDLVSSLSNFEIDPYSHYTALETGEIQRDLLGKEFSTISKPQESFKRGSGGLSSSGIRRRGNSIEDDFYTGIGSINEEENTSLNNIYTDLGNNLTNIIESNTALEGGPFAYDEATYLADYYNNYVTSWGDYDAWATGDHDYPGPSTDSGSQEYYQEAATAYSSAVEACISDAMSGSSGNPSDYLTAMSVCTGNMQELGDG